MKSLQNLVYAVSYTHLDVYKRQDGKLITESIVEYSGKNLKRLYERYEAVSYTQLDVYKRQVYEREKLWLKLPEN